MKRKLIGGLPSGLPEEIYATLRGGAVYDSSCSPEARVYYIERDGGYYLKLAAPGTLAREAEMTEYFHSLGLGAEVLHYSRGERDILLSSRVVGEDMTDARYLSEPKRLAVLLGESLRALHEVDPVGCPVTDRVGEYLALADRNFDTGCYDKSHFPDSFGYRSEAEARAVLDAGRHLLCNEVLIHGDYCLPNIMLDGWRLSGFIDLGNAGIGERHIDLFWGAWTLGFNLHTDAYRDLFFDAYGRDKIDRDRLAVVAAAEVFG